MGNSCAKLPSILDLIGLRKRNRVEPFPTPPPTPPETPQPPGTPQPPTPQPPTPQPPTPQPATPLPPTPQPAPSPIPSRSPSPNLSPKKKESEQSLPSSSVWQPVMQNDLDVVSLSSVDRNCSSRLSQSQSSCETPVGDGTPDKKKMRKEDPNLKTSHQELMSLFKKDLEKLPSPGRECWQPAVCEIRKRSKNLPKPRPKAACRERTKHTLDYDFVLPGAVPDYEYIRESTKMAEDKCLRDYEERCRQREMNRDSDEE